LVTVPVPLQPSAKSREDFEPLAPSSGSMRSMIRFTLAIGTFERELRVIRLQLVQDRRELETPEHQ